MEAKGVFRRATLCCARILPEVGCGTLPVGRGRFWDMETHKSRTPGVETQEWHHEVRVVELCRRDRPIILPKARLGSADFALSSARIDRIRADLGHIWTVFAPKLAPISTNLWPLRAKRRCWSSSGRFRSKLGPILANIDRFRPKLGRFRYVIVGLGNASTDVVPLLQHKD